MLKQSKLAHIVAVDMGYGHLRAAYPLTDLSGGEVVTANNYRGIPEEDKDIWKMSQQFYEFISRFKHVPLLGEAAFQAFDKYQSIEPFYPKRDLSKPTMQLKQTLHMVRKKVWGKDLIERLAKEPLPMINTFFVTAFMAEEHDYPGDIYLVVSDTDMSRAWVTDKPNSSRIIYLAPTKRVVERLRMYGVRDTNIHFTGFPLPKDIVGDNKLSQAKEDLGRRLPNLDPNKNYLKKYDQTIDIHLEKYYRQKSDQPLTITFAVGGAGAQRNTGVQIIKGLRKHIIAGEIRIILISGIHNDVNRYFKDQIRGLGLANQIGKNIQLEYAANKPEYFAQFNKAIRRTDILWTKPSELSFYTALGLPIIMSDPIGSQEFFNRDWIEMLGSGMRQGDILYTEQWLYDTIERGWFAEAAMEGFLEAPNMGTYKIEDIIKNNKKSE